MKHSHLLYNDFLVSDEKFSLIPVEKYPGLLQTEPMPAVSDLEKYYKSEEYLSHANKVNGLLSWIYFQVKKINLKKKYNLVRENDPVKKVLDYGCGTGDFVQYLKQQGVTAYGFEPNTDAYKIAIDKNPKAIFNTTDFLSNEKFDVITLWHVLEHIPNLTEIIKKLKSALNPKGKLIVAVPNYKSYDAAFYQNYWAAYDVPRHIWHFDQNSMRTLMNEFGMIIESTYPMLFDSFYVSLLSEKYKKTPLGFVRGIWIGMISNLKGYKTGEFSSLIYKIGLK